ncbi:uncharacterized protein LOC111708237 [Eurytemora carolleeae]|uniref:uncharacterized protein LOC111708237 n=1 Tax=Eurytemora carolleeae TaxID=1294199 RepID=UPI000C79069C|nr:uncharacterized protein LOC111708237 [Eurytemora carolleeae]|eukprot:XP_023337314.1 uncharacterized protein LOC111708237 [Eurytemora affinis]
MDMDDPEYEPVYAEARSVDPTLRACLSLEEISLSEDWLLNKTVKATPAPVLPAPVLARAAPVPGPVGRFKYLQVVDSSDQVDILNLTKQDIQTMKREFVIFSRGIKANETDPAKFW